MKKEILLQPNNLIKSKYNFSTIENKLFYKILFKAQKMNDNSKGYNSILSIDEIKDIIKFKNDTTLENIENILAVYQQSILQFDYIDESGELNTFTGGLTGPAIYNYQNQEFRINLHEVLYKHITDFIQLQRDGYTPLNLEVLFRFKGAYTQRFYTLLRLWSREKKKIDVSIKLKEIRNYLKLEEHIYPQYKHFKHNIIKRALKEINEKGNMQVDIKNEIRKGRKVEEIVFSVIDDEPRVYFDKKNSKVDCKTKISDKTTVSVKAKNEFYVPNKKLFTSKTLHMFEQDFKKYDFSLKDFKKVLQDSILITLEKDDEEKIKLKSYNYFKATLTNKIKDLEGAKQNEFTPKANTRFHNITQTYNKYNPDELEYMLNENQKEKFGENHHLVNLYNSVINDNKWNELSDISKRNLIKYANENELFIPGEWQMSLEK